MACCRFCALRAEGGLTPLGCFAGRSRQTGEAMGESADWDRIRRDFESGASLEEVAARHGVGIRAVRTKAMHGDWRGQQTQKRRKQVVDILLKAAEQVVAADTGAEAERRAKALAAVASVAKAVRDFDPKLAAACEGEDGEDAQQFETMRREFDAEIERLIEQRVAERVDIPSERG